LGKRLFIFILVAILSLVGIVTIAYYLKQTVDEQCTGVGYLPENLSKTSIHPIKVVVEPFDGQHQVYAIFRLDQAKSPPSLPVVLTVIHAGKYCESTNYLGQNFAEIAVPNQYYLSQHYIRTRTALWLTVQGLLGELRKPSNWILTYAESKQVN
jgi:hypothetical protein